MYANERLDLCKLAQYSHTLLLLWIDLIHLSALKQNTAPIAKLMSTAFA